MRYEVQQFDAAKKPSKKKAPTSKAKTGAKKYEMTNVAAGKGGGGGRAANPDEVDLCCLSSNNGLAAKGCHTAEYALAHVRLLLFLNLFCLFCSVQARRNEQRRRREQQAQAAKANKARRAAAARDKKKQKAQENKGKGWVRPAS